MRAKHIGFLATAVAFSLVSAAFATEPCTCGQLVEADEGVCFKGVPGTFTGNCQDCSSNDDCDTITGGAKPICIVNPFCPTSTMCEPACDKGLVCPEAGPAQTLEELLSGDHDCEEPTIPPPPPPVPTVSGWGIASVVLLLLMGLTIKFGMVRFSRKAA